MQANDRPSITPKGAAYLARRQPPVAPALSPLNAAALTVANTGDPLPAVRIVAAVCVRAAAVDARECPPIAAVSGALASAVAAGADVSRADLDALALALSRWCESASTDAYDNLELSPLVLAAVNAAAACSCATARR